MMIDNKNGPSGLATALVGGGSGMSFGSSVMSGNALKDSAEFQASQLEQKAGQTVASGLQAAKEERRQARLVQSKLTAANAAGGGSGDDVSTNKLYSDIGGLGEYNALSKMFGAQEDANYLKDEAKAKRYEGKQAKTAGYLEGITTATTNVGDWYSKYGDQNAKKVNFNAGNGTWSNYKK